MKTFDEWWKEKYGWKRDTAFTAPHKENAREAWNAALKEKEAAMSSPSSAGLVASLEDVKRLIDSPTLTAACGCYSEQTGGAIAAYFALDKVTLRVQKIIDEISD
jgi:hypothetical protein